MLFDHTTYIGIDPTAGKRPFVYAALGNDLLPMAIGQGDMDAVLAFVAGQRHAIVAVTAPRRPNKKIMQNQKVRDNLSPSPNPGRWMNFRVVEYLLWQHNIRIPQTASQENDCPNWMQNGFKLFKRLESLDYQEYKHGKSPNQSLEVYPHACFATLLGHNPLAKRTLEGRLQRQLILSERGLDLPDPMEFFQEITRYRLMQGILPYETLYTTGELDAIVAAYTAMIAASDPESITLLGDPTEGQIVLPVPELKGKY